MFLDIIKYLEEHAAGRITLIFKQRQMKKAANWMTRHTIMEEPADYWTCRPEISDLVGILKKGDISAKRDAITRLVGFGQPYCVKYFIKYLEINGRDALYPDINGAMSSIIDKHPHSTSLAGSNFSWLVNACGTTYDELFGIRSTGFAARDYEMQHDIRRMLSRICIANPMNETITEHAEYLHKSVDIDYRYMVLHSIAIAEIISERLKRYPNDETALKLKTNAAEHSGQICNWIISAKLGDEEAIIRLLRIFRFGLFGDPDNDIIGYFAGLGNPLAIGQIAATIPQDITSKKDDDRRNRSYDAIEQLAQKNQDFEIDKNTKQTLLTNLKLNHVTYPAVAMAFAHLGIIEAVSLLLMDSRYPPVFAKQPENDSDSDPIRDTLLETPLACAAAIRQLLARCDSSDKLKLFEKELGNAIDLLKSPPQEWNMENWKTLSKLNRSDKRPLFDDIDKFREQETHKLINELREEISRKTNDAGIKPNGPYR